jgi:ribosome-binding factor A
MADRRRADRVGEAIRSEVATFLREGARDPRLVGMITVTAVEVARDLRHARVFVTVMGSDAERAATLDALEGMQGHLRSRLARVLSLRVAPELSFRMDESVARAAKIESLLAQVRDQKPGDEGSSG